MTSIFGVPVDAAYHLVSGLTTVLTPVLGGLAAVAAIVLATAALRLLLTPLSFRAMRAQAIAARLTPQLQALQQKYGKQPERLQRELTAVYKRAGTSMFASVSPMLLQWPVVSVLYLLFRSPRVAGVTNTLLTHDLLGVPLGRYLLSGPGIVSTQGAVFLGVYAALAVLCWLVARLARAAMPSAAVPSAAVPSSVAATGGAGPLIRVLPYLTVVFAAFAPLAAGIYLVTTTAWSALERRLFRGTASRLASRAEPPAEPSRRKSGSAVPPGRPG
jgi:YidC/Oxa1 family membrane protein insertase